MAFSIHAGASRGAEISTQGNARLEYKYDDNIRVTTSNRIGLSGWRVEGGGTLRYATPQFTAVTGLRLYSDKYDNVDTADITPGVSKPRPSDFDSDNQDLTASLTYDMEHNHFSLDGRYWRDSTLNTQFVDTGLGGPATIEGATRRESTTISPAWRWDMTERQQLQSTLSWQRINYKSPYYIDYDYSLASFNWSYLVNEAIRLQLVPQFSYYENQSANKVESTTYGLQVGSIWQYAENLSFNLLLGATRVDTKIDGGYYTFDLENFQIVFVKFDDQKTTGFTGSFNLDYERERSGLLIDISSRYSPSGDGGMREDLQGRVTYYWKPAERVRVDFDSRYGRSKNVNDRINQQRDYGEAGVQVGYQFAREWWLSARYRYRTQKYDNTGQGTGNGNLLSASISYRLPKEIL